MRARDLLRIIIVCQCETGNPFILYKDSCNRKSNQSNLGTIRCSNLCTEIVQYSDPKEMGVCNIGSVALSKCIRIGRRGRKYFNLKVLKRIVGVLTRNLNKIIDITEYPTAEARYSNLQHRPIGVGVQGLADTFAILGFPYDGEKAQRLNVVIFETIYFAALSTSCQLAKESQPYRSYYGSPMSRGILQFDMWNTEPRCNAWDWGDLRRKIALYGVRNSLLVALMPTASTAQIMGNNESFEPFTSNYYVRKVLSGDYSVINRHLVNDLSALGMWNDGVRAKIIENRGSVQNITEIPKRVRDLYKTVFEIPQRSIIQMSAARAPFIDQSQSLTLHIANPEYNKILSMHYLTWKSGLKTGMYYLRTKPATNAAPQKYQGKMTRQQQQPSSSSPIECESCQ
jgi:ribonucleoside-diphosphate reductase subunit M1